MESEGKPEYRVSVRELAEFGFRSGNLSDYTVSRIRGVEGTRVHQRVQRSRPEGYQSEVAVACTVELDELVLVISGRIDGVRIDGGRLSIEEIKSTRRDAALGFPEISAHWAQGKIYAWIYASRHGFDGADVVLTYAQVDELHEESRSESLDIEALRAFFHQVIARFESWARRQTAWQRLRNRSIRELPFPYPEMRPGQQDMMDAVREAVANRNKLFCEAPTGIGKTMSALFPSLQAAAEGALDRVFYLCAKTSGKAIAEQAFADLRAAGLRAKVITLTAKDKVRCADGLPCVGAECPHGIGYYDRVNDAVSDLFEQDAWTREAIEETARKHRVCTFPFSLDLSFWADAVICDYNYAFDPRVYLRHFFDEAPGKYAFLVDEAHNLVDRARDMFSAEVVKEDFAALKKAVRKDLPGVARQCGVVGRAMADVQKEGGEQEAFAFPDKPAGLIRSLRGFTAAAEHWLAANEDAPWKELLLQVFFSANAFLQTVERYDERYVTTYERSRNRNRSREQVRLFCLDPSHLLGKAFNRCRAAVLFSATLSPIDYYGEVLARREADEVISLPSPFPPENLDIEVAPHIATTWKERGTSYRPIAELIQAFTGSRPGNYLVFFPSYAYLESVLAELQQLNVFDDLLVQRPRMTEEEREIFVRAFSSPSPIPRLGFAVMGGVFGEGIDLVGEQLIGAVVVGVGLPMVCLERNLIRGYFHEHGRDGFDYAYTFPGWTRVLQAAGRVIRTGEDEGRVLLIDRRLARRKYRDLFPPHWSGMRDVRVE